MRRQLATLSEMRSGAWTIDDVMRYNDRLDDEDEMELNAAERSRMEQQMNRLTADMERRSGKRRR